MNDSDIHELISKGDIPFIKEYQQGLREKLESINASINRVSLLLLMVIVVYFLIQHSLIKNVDLGLIQLDSLEIVVIAIPPVFAFLLLYFVIINAHRTEIYRTSKILSTYLIRNEINNPDKQLFPYDLVRLFLPFSMWEDINKVNYSNYKSGCLVGLLSLPLWGIIFLPVWFLYQSIKILIMDYWGKGLHAQLSTILSVWLVLYTIFYLFKVMLMAIKRVSKGTSSTTDES